MEYIGISPVHIIVELYSLTLTFLRCFLLIYVMYYCLPVFPIHLLLNPDG